MLTSFASVNMRIRFANSTMLRMTCLSALGKDAPQSTSTAWDGNGFASWSSASAAAAVSEILICLAYCFFFKSFQTDVNDTLLPATIVKVKVN